MKYIVWPSYPDTDCLMCYFFSWSFPFCFTDDFLTSASYDTTIKVGSNKLTLILMINWVLTLSKSLWIQETLFFYNTTTVCQTKKILVKLGLAVAPFNQLTCTVGRRGGLMLSALISGSSGPGSSPGRGHCVVFLGKTLLLSVPLSTQVYKWVPANLILRVTLRTTSIPCRGIRNIPCRFVLQKPG